MAERVIESPNPLMGPLARYNVDMEAEPLGRCAPATLTREAAGW